MEKFGRDDADVGCSAYGVDEDVESGDEGREPLIWLVDFADDRDD